MIRKLLLSLCVLFAGNIFAGGGTGDMNVSSVQQRECGDGRGFQIYLGGSHDNPDNCTNDTTLELSCTHAAYQTIVSQTLLAFAANKKINAWVAGCDNEGHAKVLALLVK